MYNTKEHALLWQRVLVAVSGALLMLAGLTFAPAVLAGDAPEMVGSELEQRLAEARRQLDDAAQKLAELNREKYSRSPKNPRKAMLGILIDDNGNNGKLRLTGITPGGGAEEAGLKPGDKIIKINGVSLGKSGASPLGNLSREMKRVTAGDPVTVVFERDGDEYPATVTTRGHDKEVTATMAALKDRFGIDVDLDGLEEGIAAAAQSVAMSAAALATPGMNMSGMRSQVINLSREQPRLIDLDESLGGYFGVEAGVLVIDAPSGSGELRNGDVLLSLNDEPVTDATLAQALIAKADTGTLEAKVRRKGRERAVKVDAGAFNKAEKIVRRIRIESTGDDMEIIVEED